MRKYQGIIAVLAILIAFVGFESCSPAKGDHPGSEYMPDMGHSIAYEANTLTEYYYNTWEEESKKQGNSEKSLRELTLHNKPVKGTIPRGYAGVINTSGKERAEKMNILHGETTTNAISVPVNGQVPYYIPNTDAGRTYAYTAPELMNNPYPISKNGLARGKELYDIYCGLCHGEKGDGNGYLVNDEVNKNVKYLAGPTNYLLEDNINAQNGKYYHAIMHGKGVMGSYKDKLSYEERWQVIHYIRALQAKEKKLAYNQYENTLNNWAVPYVDTDEALNLDGNKLSSSFDGIMADTTSTTSTALKLENVFFDTGKATLKPESKLELNVLAAILNKYETTKVELAGHTDSDGDPAANLNLSDLRANAVKSYLVAKGVNANRLQAVGYGETKPVAKNNTETGKAKNRRTEFSVLSK